MSNKSGTASQVIALPTGGGALKGIGETFKTDLFTGGGSLSVPIAIPAGRNGLQPDLHLTYSTGNGNGPFGLGWAIGVPTVSRKTSQGVPRYEDALGDAHLDTFLISGSEDLVQVAPRVDSIARFRPRTEGSFARIEQVSSGAESFWRVRTKDGLVSMYGAPAGNGSEAPVVADPANRKRIFCWYPTETRNAFDDVIEYEYERDTGEDDRGHWDQLYLATIRYGRYDDKALATARFLVSVTFEYCQPDERVDHLSDHRAGFEIRTRKRCTAIVVRTHADRDRRVRTYRLRYIDERVEAGELPDAALPSNEVSLLSDISLVGHDDDATDQKDRLQELAPIEFTYSRFNPGDKTFKPVTAAEALPPEPLGHPHFEMVALFGNALPDVVQMNGAARFWRNLGGGQFDGPRDLGALPLGVSLEDDGVQFGDFNGDGRADLLVQEGGGYFPLSFKGGFSDEGIVDLEGVNTLDLRNPDSRFVDLDGDGVVDLLKTDTDFFRLFFNEPGKGFTRVESVPRLPNPELFPDTTLSNPRAKLADLSGDGLQDFVSVQQGLIEYWPYLGHGRWGHRVQMDRSPLVEDESVTTGDGMDPRRLLFGDIDGDGLEDAVYVQPGRVTIWINRSGKSWSDPFVLETEAPFGDIDDVRLVDFLGSGTPGVLWTVRDTAEGTIRYQYLDPAEGGKSYLLSELNNHSGAITRITYSSSTEFYRTDLDSSDPARRWKTALPFPIQVVQRVEIDDELARRMLTTEYRYHEGYWDGVEREFRGFGLVEQLDTESFEALNSRRRDREGLPPLDRAHFSAPTLTRNWFHLGPIGEEFGEWSPEDPASSVFKPGFSTIDKTLLPDLQQGVLPALQQLQALDTLPRRVKRDAIRALRGSLIRSELFSLDDTDRADRPVTVMETLYGVCGVLDEGTSTTLLMTKESVPEDWRDDAGATRVFFPHVLAERRTTWERGDDPMTRFIFSDDYDPAGQPRRQTEIACPRGWRSLQDTPLKPYLATHQRTEYAQSTGAFILDRVARSTSFEAANGGEMTVLELKADADVDARLKTIGQTLNFYDGPAFVGLENGDAGTHGALVRTENLVLTEVIVEAAYKIDDMSGDNGIPPYLHVDRPFPWTSDYPQEFRDRLEALPGAAGFIFNAGDGVHERGYFATSARNAFDFQIEAGSSPRGMLRVTRDPIGNDDGSNDTTLAYDDFDLLPVKVTDPIGLVTAATYDLRVLQPVEVTDPNGNRRHYAYTALGLLKSVAVLGKPGEHVGDERLPRNGDVVEVPGTVFEYEFLAFRNSPPDARVPINVGTTRRVHHVSEEPVGSGDANDVIQMIEYSDGFGRVLQTRMLAEDETVGDAVFGSNVLSAEQGVDPAPVVLRERASGSKPNVVVSGAQVYDNKGAVVEKFEPYFDLEAGLDYRPPGDDQFGRKVTMFYDPLGRVIRTVQPDGAEERVVHGVPGAIGALDLTTPDAFEPTPWETFTYDANDLAPVTNDTLPDGRRGGSLSHRAPRHHHFTPSSTIVDALGRTVLVVARNREAPDDRDEPLPEIQEIRTRTEYDIRGNITKVVDTEERDAFEYVYDLSNTALRLKSADAGIRRVAHDAAGNEEEHRDMKGALILQSYDRLHRPTRMWARDDAESDMTLRERLEYGDEGDLDENRALNRLGALHRHHDEAGLLELTAYDFKGNVLEKSRRQIRDDAILAVFPDRAEENPVWDIRPFRVNWDPLPGRESALLEQEAHQTSMRYDALSRMTALEYPKNVEGNRARLQAAYNRSGALERVTLDSQPFVEHIAYDARGQRTFIAFGNGVMTVYAYEPFAPRLLRMVSTRFSRTGRTFEPRSLSTPDTRKQNLHQDFGYDYDLVGNLSQVRDRTPQSGIPNTLSGPDALDREFDYDAIYRLIAGTGREVDRPPDQPGDEPFDPRPRPTDFTRAGAYRERYRYDPHGNLREVVHLAINGRRGGTGFVRRFDHTQGTNQLATLTNGGVKFTYAYDKNGNLSSEGSSRHFEFDHSNRMIAFRTQVRTSGRRGESVLAEPSVFAHYLYDSAGTRVKKVVRKQGGASEVTECLDDIFEIHRAGEVKNNTLHVAVGDERVANIRVGQPFADDSSPSVKYTLTDHLGSSNVVSTDEGELANREEYTPYGEAAFGGFVRKRFRFTGKERDEESGLSYHEARYYAPWLGRWSSPDPLEMAEGTSPYPYALSAPSCFTDPRGTQSSQAAPVQRPRIQRMSVHGCTEQDPEGTAQAFQLPDFSQPPSYSHLDPRKPRHQTIKRSDPDAEFRLMPSTAWQKGEIKDDAGWTEHYAELADIAEENRRARAAAAEQRRAEEGLEAQRRALELAVDTEAYTTEKFFEVSTTIAARSSMAVIYLRVNLRTGRLYVGRTTGDEFGRFMLRQFEHTVKNRSPYSWRILERVETSEASTAEESWMRRFGGPRRYGGRIENHRYELNEQEYSRRIRSRGLRPIRRPTDNRSLRHGPRTPRPPRTMRPPRAVR